MRQPIMKPFEHQVEGVSYTTWHNYSADFNQLLIDLKLVIIVSESQPIPSPSDC